MKHLKHLMEQRQSEIDDLQRKVFAPLDTDMLRIKLMKELEAPHQIELQAKQHEAERLRE